mmetsp:Transcript_34304/g.50432  ORF Transcript_34304/g.50432 Transcript_34304/m.50432 type:complete len:191 (-) Transcript_34304:45-617(-)|eukprot:CAMPEP_0195519682 /NCGR_PEP_ID=MMETSP0794_2-20130614/15262_1 /TAXON_ID=515487 /ORGANISM="Stephanopyxis turris, Strain CCMP 815" /LENGTH=190 /DNA_ID=CAMNT_0040648875 /DNA_START=47 /DNA_END=619 /DNA_ORIENTATION=-
MTMPPCYRNQCESTNKRRSSAPCSTNEGEMSRLSHDRVSDYSFESFRKRARLSLPEDRFFHADYVKSTGAFFKFPLCQTPMEKPPNLSSPLVFDESDQSKPANDEKKLQLDHIDALQKGLNVSVELFQKHVPSHINSHNYDSTVTQNIVFAAQYALFVDSHISNARQSDFPMKDSSCAIENNALQSAEAH